MLPIRDNIPSRTYPFINILLILACTLAFGYQLLSSAGDDGGGERVIEQYGMIPRRVVAPQARISVPEEHLIRTPFGVREIVTTRTLPRLHFNPWWTLLTCIFLHGGWLHIIGNMWFLYIFGDNIEDRLGHFKYLLFYLFCGVTSSLAHLLANPASTLPTVGASGAIAGVMGAYLFLYPRAKVLTIVPIFFFLNFMVVPAPLFLGLWFLLQFLQGTFSVSGVETSGIAVWAHIGGFVVGFGLAIALRAGGLLKSAPQIRYGKF